MKKLVVGMVMAGCCAGCIVGGPSAPFQPPIGIVTSYKAPLSTEGNWKNCSKVGTSSAMSILGIVAIGDCSLKTAMDAGGLKSAEYADYEYFNVLGFYQKITLFVMGE